MDTRKEVFTETELNQIEKFWKCVEQKTKIKHPLKREDYHKTPSAIRFIKKQKKLVALILMSQHNRQYTSSHFWIGWVGTSIF